MSSRAQVRESIADAWHQRRQQQQQNSHRLPTQQSIEKARPTSRSTLTNKGKDQFKNPYNFIPSLCFLVQKAWERAGLPNSKPEQGKSLSTAGGRRNSERNFRLNNNNNQVFPSILSILQAHVLVQQVEFLRENNHHPHQQADARTEEQKRDKQVIKQHVLSILPSGYDWDRAIRQMAESRSQAFWLIDLAAPIGRLVQWQRTYPACVRFLFRLSANADAVLLRVLERMENTGLIVQSNWDLEQCHRVHARHMYDDTAAASCRPDSYIRRAVFGKTDSAAPEPMLSSLTIDGPAEVDRIVQTIQRLASRRGLFQPPKVNFVLRLPTADIQSWPSLLAETVERIHAVGSQLTGISVALDAESAEYTIERQEGIARLFQTATLNDMANLRVDLTGISDLQPNSWWCEILPTFPQVGEITVDATEPLIATNGALCTRIIGVKVTPDQRRHYYIDDGCYGSLYQARDDNPLPLGANGALDTQNVHVSTIWGPTCDGLDRVCPQVELPTLQKDDWIVFPNIRGTSGEGLGTAFNGFCPPDTVYCVLGYFQ